MGGGDEPSGGLAGMEALNEWSYLGRLLVNRPLIGKALTAPALTGTDDALRTFGLTRTAKTAGLLRVIGTQALAQAGIQAEAAAARDWRQQLDAKMAGLFRRQGER
jgi:hypothetical protein